MSAVYILPLYVTKRGSIRKSRHGPESYSATNRITVKKNDTVQFAIQFIDDDDATPYLLTAAVSQVAIAVKEDGKYDGSVVVGGSTSTDPATASDPYLVSVLFDSGLLDTLLGEDGDDSNDVESVDLMFEVTWTENSGLNWMSTISPVEVRIYNDVTKSADLGAMATWSPKSHWIAKTASDTSAVAGNYHNTGASGQVIMTMAATADGSTYRGIVAAAQNFRFKAAAGKYIRAGGSVSASGGYIQSSTVGNRLELVLIGDTYYAQLNGVWTLT